jgi:sulfonate transport system permease protein
MKAPAEALPLDRAPVVPRRRPAVTVKTDIAANAPAPTPSPTRLSLLASPKLQRLFLPWLIPALAVVFWVVATEAGWVSKHVLPKPIAVWDAVVDLFKNGFARDLAISTRRAFGGLAVGTALGLILGMVAGLNRTGDLLLDTTMQMKRTVPTLAILPLIIIWFGIGETMRTVLIALGALFPVYVNTYYGIRSVDPALLEVGRVYGLKRLAQFRQIILPAALPSILLGLRFALGGMWLSLIAAEMIGTTSGIGFVTNIAREFMQTDVVLFILFLYAFLGKATDMVVRHIERAALPWHHSYNGNLNR